MAADEPLVGAQDAEDGMHALRPFHASTLESIKALSEYLGHGDPGFTPRVYTHLMLASEERTRRGSTWRCKINRGVTSL